MAWAIFLKGANTGGLTFRPSRLPAALPDLGLTSLGAAGTFVARSSASARVVRDRIAAALPFTTPIVVRPGREVLDLVRRDPAGAGPLPAGGRKFVTVATGPLDPAIQLPVEAPGPTAWEVRVLAVDGPYAVGVRRRLGPRPIYPNDVVERTFDAVATTRWWETLEAVGARLAEG